MIRETAALVIVGFGAAGRAAAAVLPEARVIARPHETVWHAQDHTLWIERADGVCAVTFLRLLLCAREPLLLLSLGCTFQGGLPVIDDRGETSRPEVFVAGSVLGATVCEAAAAQGRIAARAMAGLPAEGRIALTASDYEPPTAFRLDPVGIAALLEQPVGPERDRAAQMQAALLGAVLPARPVGFAALAAAAEPITDRPIQTDTGLLS